MKDKKTKARKKQGRKDPWLPGRCPLNDKICPNKYYNGVGCMERCLRHLWNQVGGK